MVNWPSFIYLPLSLKKQHERKFHFWGGFPFKMCIHVYMEKKKKAPV